MEKKLRVGVLGATGMVGQRFISLLENHPWYEVSYRGCKPAFCRKNLRGGCRRTLENDHTNAGSSKEAGSHECQ